MIKKILLVDDDLDDADFLDDGIKQFRTQIDFTHVESCEDLFGHLALNINNLPDLILMDLNMPKVSGFQYLQQLKITDDYKKTPVFMYSTSSLDHDKEMARDLGAAGFITKPFDSNSLTEILKTIFSRDRNQGFSKYDYSNSGY